MTCREQEYNIIEEEKGRESTVLTVYHVETQNAKSHSHIKFMHAHACTILDALYSAF